MTRGIYHDLPAEKICFWFGSMISEAVKAQLLQGDAVNALRAAKEAQQLGFGWMKTGRKMMKSELIGG